MVKWYISRCCINQNGQLCWLVKKLKWKICSKAFSLEFCIWVHFRCGFCVYCVGCKNNIQSFQQIFFSLFFLVSQIPIKITLNSFWMSWSTILTWVPINNGKKQLIIIRKKNFFYSHFNQRQIRLRRTAFFSLSNISRFKCERE